MNNNPEGGGKDLQTAATFAQKKEAKEGVATTSTKTASIPIGISSPFLMQEIKIELPASSTSTTTATTKTPIGSFSQPIRFPKVNTANNRVPAGSSKQGM